MNLIKNQISNYKMDYDEYLKERLAGIELIQFYKDKNNCGTVFDSKEENDKSI